MTTGPEWITEAELEQVRARHGHIEQDGLFDEQTPSPPDEEQVRRS